MFCVGDDSANDSSNDTYDGYDPNGYDPNGYDANGYDAYGYDINGDFCPNSVGCTGVIVNCECLSEEISVIATSAFVFSVYYEPDGAILIKASNGSYKKPSAFNPNLPGDRRIMNMFAASLARNLDGLNKNIVITSTKAVKLSSENQASTKYPVTIGAINNANVISLNTNGGYSKDLNNVNNFKSIVKHEILHAEDNNKGVRSNLSTHTDVYINAMKQTSFKETTKDFKEGIIRSLAQFILKMDKQPNTPYNISTIKDKIDSFNLLNLKYQFFVPSGYKTIGNLTINLRDITQYDNGTPIIYNPNHTDEK